MKTKFDNLISLIENAEQDEYDNNNNTGHKARKELYTLLADIGGHNVEIDSYMVKIAECKSVVYFLLKQLENVICDGDDFDENDARGRLAKIGIDLDKEFAQP